MKSGQLFLFVFVIFIQTDLLPITCKNKSFTLHISHHKLLFQVINLKSLDSMICVADFYFFWEFQDLSIRILSQNLSFLESTNTS